MSIEINAIDPTQSVASAGAGSAQGVERSAPATVADQQAVHVDTLPSTPPQALYDAMARASDACDRLAANGQHLHFSLGAQGKLSVELQKLSGERLGTVSASQVLALASGDVIE